MGTSQSWSMPSKPSTSESRLQVFVQDRDGYKVGIIERGSRFR